MIRRNIINYKNMNDIKISYNDNNIVKLFENIDSKKDLLVENIILAGEWFLEIEYNDLSLFLVSFGDLVLKNLENGLTYKNNDALEISNTIDNKKYLKCLSKPVLVAKINYYNKNTSSFYNLGNFKIKTKATNLLDLQANLLEMLYIVNKNRDQL